MQPIAVGRLLGLHRGLFRLNRLVVGINIAADTHTIFELVHCHIHILAAGAHLPVAILVVKPSAHIGMFTGSAAEDAIAVGELVFTLIDLLTTCTDLPVLGCIVLPLAHLGVVTGRLVVGIGIATEANAILEDMLTLRYDFTTFGTGRPVAVLVILPIVHIFVLTLGLVNRFFPAADAFAIFIAMLAFVDLLAAFAGLPVAILIAFPSAHIAVVAFGGLIFLEYAGQFCIGVQDSQRLGAVHRTQSLQDTVSQAVAVEFHGGSAIDGNVDHILGHTGHRSAIQGLQFNGTGLGNRNVVLIGIADLTVLDLGGKPVFIQIAFLIQDHEVIVIRLTVLAQLGTDIDDRRQLTGECRAGCIQFKVALAVAGDHEGHSLAGAILAVGDMNSIAAQSLSNRGTGGGIHQGDLRTGNAGEVRRRIVCIGRITGGSTHGKFFGRIYLLIGKDGVAILSHAGNCNELAVQGAAGSVTGVILLQGLVLPGLGVDPNPFVTGSSLDVAIDVVHFLRLHRLVGIGHFGDRNVQIACQAQAHQIVNTFQSAQLTQLVVGNVIAVELDTVFSGMGDHNAAKAIGFDIGDGNIVAIIENQAGSNVVHLPAGIVRGQLAVHNKAVYAEGLQEAVIAQNVIMIKPEAFQFTGRIVRNTRGAAIGFQRCDQEVTGGVVTEHSQIIAVAVEAADVSRETADFHFFSHGQTSIAVIVVQHHGLLGGSRTIEHMHEGCAVAIGEVIALCDGVSITGRIDSVVVGVVGRIDDTVADQCAGVNRVRRSQLGIVHRIAVNCDPLAAVFCLDVGVEHHIQAIQRLEGDGGAGSYMLAVVIELIGGGGNGNGTGSQSGNQAVAVHSRDRLIAAGPSNTVVRLSQIDLCGQLHRLVHIALGRVGLDSDKQVIQSVVRVQGNNRPDIHAEGAHLNRRANIGLEDIHRGGLAVAVVRSYDQIVICDVIVHRTLIGTGGIAHTGQVQTGAAHIGQIIIIDHAQAGIIESVQHLVIQFAAFGNDVVLMAIADIHTIKVGSRADVGDQSCGIFRKGGVVNDLIAHTLFHIHNTNAHTAIDDTDQPVKVAIGGLGAGGSIAPQPGLMQVAVIGHREVIGIHSVHMVAIMNIKDILMQAAGQELVAFGYKVAGPILGVQQIEVHPFDIAVGIVQHTVEFHIRNVLHRDNAGSGQVGCGFGSSGDGGYALAHCDDVAGSIDSNHIHIGTAPVEALILQIPRKHVVGQLILGADQQIQGLAAKHQLAGDGIHIQIHTLLGNDVQTGNIDTQAAHAVIFDAGDRLTLDNGSLTGGKIEGIQTVVAAGSAQCSRPVQNVIVMIPCHGLDGGTTGGRNVIAVNVVAGIAVIVIIHGAQIRNGTVLDILGRPGVQI